MSNNNNPATKQIFVGVAIAVISTAVLTWLGLNNRVTEIEPSIGTNVPQPLPGEGGEPTPPGFPLPEKEENPNTPHNSTIPNQPDNSEVTKLELEDFFNKWSSNPELIKDNFDNIKISFVGYIDQNSIKDCEDKSRQTTRCMTLYSNINYIGQHFCEYVSEQIIQCPNYGFFDTDSNFIYQLRLAFEPGDIEETKKINRLLFSSQKLLTMTIETKLIFNDENNFKLVDWQIVDYRPYEESY